MQNRFTHPSKSRGAPIDSQFGAFIAWDAPHPAHAREMGDDDRQPPFFFTKPADAIVANDASVPYPSRTSNFHHEVELVVALANGGANIAANQATALIFGYAVGIDLTRRDLQSDARDHGRPWDLSKGFDRSAPVAAISAVNDVDYQRGRIWLKVNGNARQDARAEEMA